MTIIQGLQEFFLSCPLMGDNKINVDYLPEDGIQYSINTSPATAIIKTYTDGSTMRQYEFDISSVNPYSSNELQSIANSGFYEELSDWLEQQNRIQNFPILPSEKTPIKIETLSTGYLFTTTPKSGRYQIQCRLIYLQEA
ncbi:hypothetical protein [Scatolibacter rhodanostii]|uniref:hypothetical protein n=1 Tax=Scatolibacter rhodanostii TaxID=2014781 RepID=UPI000C071DC7|nr:hypothetical protein [Scatolibacter rhodanostii]